MKVIEVVAAVIKRDDEIFVTRRSYGDFKDMWEFPGGKVENQESREDALHREIREELELDITNLEYLTTVDYDYDTFHLKMHCYTCEISGGELKLNAHNDAKWIKASEMDELNWVPADVTVAHKLKQNDKLNKDRVIFENSIILTLENLNHIYKIIMKKPRVIITQFVIMIFVLFIVNQCISKESTDNTTGLILSLMVFIGFLYACFNSQKTYAKKQYDKNLKMYKSEIENKLSFYEDYISWKCIQSKCEISFKYEDISEVIETKKIYTFIYEKTHFSASKSGFIKGTEQDFHNFIINKCTNAKIRKSNIN